MGGVNISPPSPHSPPRPPPPHSILVEAESLTIGQYDGNASILSNESDENSSLKPVFQSLKIPTQIGYRPPNINFERPPHSRVTIRRDNRKVQALGLPIICNYNVRSLWSKINNLALDMNERESDLNFLTEVWEKRENKKHQQKLEELFEMSGIKYISTPRPGAKRGGGAAIAVREQRFTLSKLNISLPSSIEVVWGLLRPKNITGKISKIIVCCFYSPPRSRKKNILVDHLTITLQSLLNIHPAAGVIISGDRNDLNISTLLSIDPSLRQTVQHNTRGQQILDVIVTNLSRYYDQPVIVPPLQPDQPGRGAPSDHHGVVATPRSNKSVRITKMKKKIRPLPDSLLRVFRSKLEAQNFHFHTGLEVDQMVDRFTKVTNDLFCEVFPEKTIIVSPEDKPWFNEQLRQI